jgi:hypothetical protein
MEGESRLAPGRWVRVHRSELAPSERAGAIPADTASLPFETWTNGWLVEEAALGERTRIRTMTGRIVEGDLVEANPGYTHTFGSPPQALQRAGERAQALLVREVRP